jgi:hypothetical protein
MAKVDINNLFQSLRGKIGNLVFRYLCAVPNGKVIRTTGRFQDWPSIERLS